MLPADQLKEELLVKVTNLAKSHQVLKKMLDIVLNHNKDLQSKNKKSQQEIKSLKLEIEKLSSGQRAGKILS